MFPLRRTLSKNTRATSRARINRRPCKSRARARCERNLRVDREGPRDRNIPVARATKIDVI